MFVLFLLRYQSMWFHVIHLPIPKNIERHAAHNIASWPNRKQWVIVHTFDLMMIIRQSKYIFSIITREMGKQKIHSPTYCIMDNWENMLNLTHTRQNIPDRHLISSMSSDKFAQWWYCTNERVRSASRLFALIINCTIMMKTNSRFLPEHICNKWPDMI